jgi:hypothetical protein
MSAIRKVLDRVYVGSDEGVAEAKRRDMSRVCSCKDGPDGHRAMLGYTTLGAPKNSEYLFASRGHWGAMNLIDNDDVSMIADSMVYDALRFAKKEWDAGRTLFFHCNHGHERGPTTALMFLRAIGQMPYTYTGARRIFGTLYPDYVGVETEGLVKKAKQLWASLPSLFTR